MHPLATCQRFQRRGQPGCRRRANNGEIVPPGAGCPGTAACENGTRHAKGLPQRFGSFFDSR